MSGKKYGFSSPKTLLNHALGLDYFLPNKAGLTPIPMVRVDGNTPLVLVLGENASGKSFLRRILMAICNAAKQKTEFMGISMEGRRKVSMYPWWTFVYGDEDHEATGVNSAGTVLSGISTCLARDERHVIFWDEPDLGLSDSWAAGVGQTLKEFAQKPGKETVAAFVVSHSRALVQQLLPINPTYLHLGEDPEKAPRSLQEWLERPIQPRNPEKLREASRARFKLIDEVLRPDKAPVSGPSMDGDDARA